MTPNEATAKAIEAGLLKPEPEPEVADEFGRYESERTVVLEPKDAEAVDHEVTAGKHQTYDDALHYVIARGLAELKRTRDSQKQTQEAKKVKQARDSFNILIGSNPALASNPEFLRTMMAQIGIVLPSATK